jgi:hypothetical protein
LLGFFGGARDHREGDGVAEQSAAGERKSCEQ